MPSSWVFSHYGTDGFDFEARLQNAFYNVCLNAILLALECRQHRLECAWMLWITHIVNGAVNYAARQ
jgi:hypothetical protein